MCAEFNMFLSRTQEPEILLIVSVNHGRQTLSVHLTHRLIRFGFLFDDEDFSCDLEQLIELNGHNID